MSYSDDYKDRNRDIFLEKWAPKAKGLPELTEENLRYNIARANAAEAKLQNINIAVATVKRELGL